MSDKLPENLVSIDVLRVNRKLRKVCRCEKPKFIVDTTNHLVECGKCGVYVDPFYALIEIARGATEFKTQLERLYEQRKEIENYKPHLVVMKRLEREYRNGMLPSCPKCNKTFDPKDITLWLHRDYLVLEEENGERNK